VPLKYGSRVALKVSWGSKKGRAQYPAKNLLMYNNKMMYVFKLQ